MRVAIKLKNVFHDQKTVIRFDLFKRDQFSDDDVYDNLGENDFDLFELTEEERAELANAFKDDSESSDELDDENLPLFFTNSATF